MSSDILTLEHFRPHVGTSFIADYPEHREILTLDEAVPLPDRGFVRQGGNFRLTFTGNSDSVMLQQHTYRLAHAVMGEVDLFLVPTRRNDDGTFSYLATFA